VYGRSFRRASRGNEESTEESGEGSKDEGSAGVDMEAEFMKAVRSKFPDASEVSQTIGVGAMAEKRVKL
jgi:hypothetical protein